METKIYHPVTQILSRQIRGSTDREEKAVIRECLFLLVPYNQDSIYIFSRRSDSQCVPFTPQSFNPIGHRETDQMHLLLVRSNAHASTLLAIRIERKCDWVNRLRASHLDS